ncbi:regulatory ArsR family protein [Lacrimispora xylanisolvens]|uniref:Regulatory ArsR family protein n=1 Tax=Lacrimispora xylanisolvens TaxID=384636 RepID=A0A2S6HSK2_9FIRM|nr:metalloregulator ArsR/SmtB family transcription factor [Hungatella xylanolytica]MBE5986320.1 winged helix-turn-helix transcriptional regulator [Paenibacillaceae bacterium]PPK80561.1 regulatory ArsR family protein [Hungatella xylanolytica]
MSNNIEIPIKGNDKIIQMTEFFKVLGDPVRIKILSLLYCDELCVNELCVNELAEILEASASSISHQLRILRVNRFVNKRRDGKLVYYSLANEQCWIMKHITQKINDSALNMNF